MVLIIWGGGEGNISKVKYYKIIDPTGVSFVGELGSMIANIKGYTYDDYSNPLHTVFGTFSIMNQTGVRVFPTHFVWMPILLYDKDSNKIEFNTLQDYLNLLGVDANIYFEECTEKEFFKIEY